MANRNLWQHKNALEVFCTALNTQQSLQRQEFKSWGIWSRAHWLTAFVAQICADMDVFLPLAAGDKSHLHCERRNSYPESLTKLRKGLKGSQISALSSVCLSSINNTHINAVVQEQIRKVEFFSWCNSLHLLTFFPLSFVSGSEMPGIQDDL